MRSLALIAVFFCVVSLRAADVDTFKSKVEPILADRCYECHGEKKQKGKLRLDSPEAILKGGKNGPAVKSGDPQKSSIFERISLKPEDDDIMPAKGKPLTPEQIAIIGDWIKSGASFGKAEVQTDPAAK